ncbi:MAG TPA: glycosyltransferase [Flavisolibacter sp.]|nr:glycosyltransferase [Flavisolibacter sp.]
MAIPKTIIQTFKTASLPFVHRWHINKFRKKNNTYNYQFFTDADIEDFLATHYGLAVTDAYRRIQIGAAKADFFRYAVLYKQGGVYVDIDSAIVSKLDDFLQPDDKAVISYEFNPDVFVQWALIYDAGHPFLSRALDIVLENIKENKYPHDVFLMTGPGAYTRAVRECLAANPGTPHRILGIDYSGHLKFKFPLSKLAYSKGEHWKKQQLVRPVLHEAAS